MKAKEMTDNEIRVEDFHSHLDECERCRTRPFDLCPEGEKRLKEAAKRITARLGPFLTTIHPHPHALT